MTVLSDAQLGHLRLAAAAAAAFEHPRYEIHEQIGEGGMGRVYRARDRELGREVAVKVLRAQLADPAAADRTRQEARILARLEHPGIVPVHDVGQTPDGRIFYVMKLVRGQRLDQRFAVPPAAGSAALAERLRVFERICETVAFAHARGVIHRDLKPQNVMVGEFGEVLVLDWGIARVRAEPTVADRNEPARAAASGCDDETATRQTRRGTVLGTPAYMAPEQARGETTKVGEHSDVFALGAVLHFLLTGCAPVGRTVAQQLPARNEPAFDSPRRTNPAVPRPLAAVCLRALALAPADRYASAAELAADVARFRAGGGVSAYRENFGLKAARVTWNYRAPIALIAAYLLFRWLLLPAL